MSEKKETRGFRFGALSPKLSEQLKGELPKDELKWLDKYADAVTLLVIQELLSESEARKARQRIVKRIEKLVLEQAKPVVKDAAWNQRANAALDVTMARAKRAAGIKETPDA